MNTYIKNNTRTMNVCKCTEKMSKRIRNHSLIHPRKRVKMEGGNKTLKRHLIFYPIDSHVIGTFYDEHAILFVTS